MKNGKTEYMMVGCSLDNCGRQVMGYEAALDTVASTLCGQLTSTILRHAMVDSLLLACWH